MNNLRQVVEFMTEPGDQDKRWLIPAIVSHCVRLAYVLGIPATRVEIFAMVNDRLSQFESEASR